MAVTDWDDEPTSPRLDFSQGDPHTYGHLPTLVDGATKQEIKEDTALVALYQYRDPSVDNELLWNLTHVARPAVPCQFVDADGASSWLLLAPVIRLQCDFSSVSSLSVILEWHFNEYNAGDNRIRGYHHKDELLTFSAGAATCAGLNNAVAQYESLGPAERQVLNALRKYTESGRHILIFKLYDNAISSSQLQRVSQLRSRLRGGNDRLLGTLRTEEYVMFGRDRFQIPSWLDGIRKPFKLLNGRVKDPMVDLDCPNTFSSVKEAGVQLAYSATVLDAEAEQALKLWTTPRTPHRGHLFAYGELPCFGVNFGLFGRLGSVSDDIHFRLPSEMHTELSFSHWGVVRRCKGFLMGNTSGLPTYDAIFCITSHKLRSFKRNGALFNDDADTDVGIRSSTDSDVNHGPDAQLDTLNADEEVDIEDCKINTYTEVVFKPVSNKFTYFSQLDTVAQLQRTGNSRWHGILLNQLHEGITETDITASASIPTATRQAAAKWLRNWKCWNKEELAVIDGITRAKGGLCLVFGPAGTGKTLLQQALAIYFYKLGYHVLALTPANSNADHLARIMETVNNDDNTVCVDSLRLYPSSKDSGLDQLTERQAAGEKVEQTQDNLSLTELVIALEELKRFGKFVNSYGVVETVIWAALERNLKLVGQLHDEHGRAIDEIVDAWEILREFLAVYNEKIFDPKAPVALLKAQRAYRACKGHILGLNRFMVTTTGNVRATDLVRNWSQAKHGTPTIGVVVFVDEAAKDLEVNVWAGVVCEAWAHAVKGFFMFGDDRQLKPTNTCSKGAVQFNSFNARLDLPLPCRLVNEGFPCYRLKEQRRMHTSIAQFPNNTFYEGQLRNGPGTSGALDDSFPGLRACLQDILSSSFSTVLKGRDIASGNESDLRLAWIQIVGKRERIPSLMSQVVKNHVTVFFDMVFPKLQDFFCGVPGATMRDNVMIICAYSAAIVAYRDHFSTMLRQDRRLTADDLPRLATVDASQGDESFMVILDGSWQDGDVVGFMNDAGRINVATTRAKGVFWILGGKMTLKYKKNWDNDDYVINHITKYKRVLDRAGKVHELTDGSGNRADAGTRADRLQNDACEHLQ